MIDWEEYLKLTLEHNEEYNDLMLSLNDGQASINIPPIIKSSIQLLDKMVEKQGKYNVLILPEKKQSFVIFVLIKLIHNVLKGRIGGNYDPTAFLEGEKLRVGNAIVEYVGTETIKGKLYLIIQTKNIRLREIIDNFPVFQKVTTKKQLSTYAKYNTEKERVLTLIKQSKIHGTLQQLFEIKTHLESSIYVMSSVTGMKEQLSHTYINDRKVTDLLYMGQANYQGEISNINPGQMSGVPALVLATDLYQIKGSLDKGFPIQSFILDISNTNTFVNQLDALDEIIEAGIPVLGVTDISNSFDLEFLKIRGFNIWRWDEDTITETLYETENTILNTCIKNCVNHKVEYIDCAGDDINTAMRLLAKHRKETEDQSIYMMKIFDHLNHLTFSALRATIPFGESDCIMAKKTLDECVSKLNVEARFISSEVVNDYKEIIEKLKCVYTLNKPLGKEIHLKNYLRSIKKEKVYLIISDKDNKTKIQEYWNDWCTYNAWTNHVEVLYPTEYYATNPSENRMTIICGWLKRAIMRKILFSFNSDQYTVLLYNHEKRWQKHDETRWKKAKSSSSNKTIIEKSLSTKDFVISTKQYEENEEELELVSQDTVDELGEIELILRENRFRQYANGGASQSNVIVSAIPFNFVGGYLAFYQKAHKLISVTKLVTGDSDQIDQVMPNDLRVGDFIVLRETDKDLIREMADILLKNSGKAALREMASKWRDAIKIELVFSSLESFYERLKKNGCDKDLTTLKRWIDDEDLIAPQSKEDLRAIAETTENETLLELLEEIYDAASEVRRAHIIAGRKLSEKLRLSVASELKKYGDIDPFNFWEPINLEIESIGNVKVLKIMDIGSEMEVDSFDTNRLIEEW